MLQNPNYSRRTIYCKELYADQTLNGAMDKHNIFLIFKNTTI